MKSHKVNSAAKLLIMLAILSNSSLLLANEPFMLISEEEYRLQLGQHYPKYKNKKFKFKFRSISRNNQNIPLITIKSPTVTTGLYSPMRIEINFKATDGASIKADSLKVLYGWLNLDITDRIRQYGQVTYFGILANNVKLPIGEHNITIEIMDTKARRAKKKISFEIVQVDNR